MKANPEKKWDALVKEYLGEELAGQAIIEADATALNAEAKIKLLEYKTNTSLETKLASDENVISAFIIENKEVKKRIK
jgi:hypothetical protein